MPGSLFSILQSSAGNSHSLILPFVLPGDRGFRVCGQPSGAQSRTET